MCPAWTEKVDKGYIILVAVDQDKSKVDYEGNVSPGDAHRLGAIVFIRKHVFEDMFSVPPPEHGLAFVDQEIVDMLEKAAV